MKAIVWTDETIGAEYHVEEIPEELKKKAAAYHQILIETVVENDDQDELMHKYIEGETIGEAELKAALRRATLKMKVFPVICGTAFKNKGVQPLLDAVIDYLPSPLDVPPVKGKNPDTGVEDRASGRRQSTIFGAGVQDHDRSVCRPADVHPRVLGPPEDRRHAYTTADANGPSALDACCRCTPTSVRKSAKSTPAISARASA